MANGTIAFDTLSTSGQISGTAKSVDTDYVVNGSSKAWVNFNGSGTVAIRDSFSITSIVDNGTGDYTITMATAMASINYAPFTSGTSNSSYTAQIPIVNFKSTGGFGTVDPTAVAFRFALLTADGATLTEPTYLHAHALGDLA